MKASFRIAIGGVALLAVLGGTGCRHADMSSCSDAQTDGKMLISACTTAIESGRLGDSDLANAYFSRARGYMLEQKYGLAVADMDTLLGKQPDNVQALGYRAGAHGMRGEWDLAQTDLLRQTVLAPNDDRAWTALAHVYQEQHDYARAEENFDHAIQLRSDNPVSLNARCWLRAIVGKQLDEALADCDRSLHFQPDDANALNSRGFVHFRKQQYPEALADLDASIDRDPKLASSYYLRGLTKIAMGQVTDSSDIARARSLEPGVADRFAGYGIPAVR